MTGGIALLMAFWITYIAGWPKSFGGWMATVRKAYDAEMRKP